MCLSVSLSLSVARVRSCRPYAYFFRHDARNLPLLCFQVSIVVLSLSSDLIIIFLFHSLIATVKKEREKRDGRPLLCDMCNVQTGGIV